jgi:hypothetical protein
MTILTAMLKRTTKESNNFSSVRLSCGLVWSLVWSLVWPLVWSLVCFAERSRRYDRASGHSSNIANSTDCVAAKAPQDLQENLGANCQGSSDVQRDCRRSQSAHEAAITFYNQRQKELIFTVLRFFIFLSCSFVQNSSSSSSWSIGVSCARFTSCSYSAIICGEIVVSTGFTLTSSTRTRSLRPVNFLARNTHGFSNW